MGKPGIVNSDQGSQFTSNEWMNLLQEKEITISMTGKGRCNDNAYIERLWRTLKYEGIYLHQWKTVRELKQELPKLIYWYNNDRPHQSLRYETPSETSRAFMDNLKSSYPQPQQLKKIFYKFIFKKSKEREYLVHRLSDSLVYQVGVTTKFYGSTIYRVSRPAWLNAYDNNYNAQQDEL